MAGLRRLRLNEVEHCGPVSSTGESGPYSRPTGFTADGSVENFKRRRQTELKHGRIWAPMGLLRSMAGVTFPPVEPVFADDACVRYPCDASWHIDNKVRNRQMHALMGNSFQWIWCFFFYLNFYILMFSALSLGSYVCDMADETENTFSGNLMKEIWMFVTSLIYFFALNAVRCQGKKASYHRRDLTSWYWLAKRVWKRKRPMGRCRCIGRCRFKAHRHKRFTPHVARAVLVCMFFTWLLICAYIIEG